MGAKSSEYVSSCLVERMSRGETKYPCGVRKAIVLTHLSLDGGEVFFQCLV